MLLQMLKLKFYGNKTKEKRYFQVIVPVNGLIFELLEATLRSLQAQGPKRCDAPDLLASGDGPLSSSHSTE